MQHSDLEEAEQPGAGARPANRSESYRLVTPGMKPATPTNTNNRPAEAANAWIGCLGSGPAPASGRDRRGGRAGSASDLARVRPWNSWDI